MNGEELPTLCIPFREILKKNALCTRNQHLVEQKQESGKVQSS